jgi:hypothetical protein
MPVMGYDFSAIREEIGEEAADKIMESDREWQRARRQRDLHSERHISFESLEELIRDLEQQTVAYCNS